MNRFLLVLSTALVIGAAVLSMRGTSQADSGCMGDCGNRRAAAEGWCGNCKDHCWGGTEADCTKSCGEPYDEGPCLKQVDADVKACNDGCNGNTGCEGNCGGKYKTDRINKCHNDKAASDDRRKGCLDGCGAEKGCRDSWCTDTGGDRKKCYEQVGQAYGACTSSCGGPTEKCSEEKCLGVARYAKCGDKYRVTGFCLSFKWNL